ncbi:unnamed protein product [Heligmosomoides polygyrus]|uniref:Obg domain-containing protein n=1 Tax=Heligmosomoides polygyrus TaxID=6339 RepID=A0A183F8V5_HELPZ|nr:unnamed protein product [Heligmosomoides polygyrus]
MLYVSSPTRWRVGYRKVEQRERSIHPAEDGVGQVDVAIEEIGVEVVDDILLGPSGRGGGSIRTSESGHLFLEVGEVPAGIVDAQTCLCSFS